MKEMEELLKMLPGGAAPVWLATSAFALRMLALDKVVVALYDDIIKPFFKSKNDRIRDQIANQVSDAAAGDILYARYISVARHLIDTAWNVLSEMRAGATTSDRIGDRLRVRTADSVDAARRSLSRYRSFSTQRKLDAHLASLTEERKRTFYAPIIAEIAALTEQEKYWQGYETLRVVVLREVDMLIAEATDMVLNEKK